jgi:flagellar biogenesis protein FliO
MQIETHAGAANPVMEFVRGAFGCIARPSLWKKRRELSVCETLSLGNRNFVAVVGYQDQRFLIAGTANCISLLADVTREPHDGARGEGDSTAD